MKLFSLFLFILINILFVLSKNEKLLIKQQLPEENLTTPEIIEYWGYNCQVFNVTTEDGYILELHRIPNGKNSLENIKENKPVIFLQHGLLASSADWITNLPHQSLGFLLADAGFDVWLGNARGNFYSSKHKKYSKNDARYWDFSWDEMSSKDLPAMIDKALSISGQSKLYYVGHSQGTEIMFCLLSNNPKYAKKIKKFFALAPVASVKHIKGLFAIIGKLFGKHLEVLIRFFGSREFLPHNWASEIFAKMICGQKWENPLCDNILFLIGGPESSQFNQTRLMIYLTHEPAGTSTKNIVHWAQMQQSGLVQKFDYGTGRENHLHYGQNIPPIYNLNKINVPIYLYYSDKDWLATTKDIENTIFQKIPKKFIKVAKKLPNFNHFDFLWGLDAPDKIYNEIILEAKEN
ncbi:Metalloendopeptidase [Meloidogyne graminicola]|uniref:Lipase n=1 Tax=Meloidogyne graminicola TaxID=189291 RepID=A0A8S9ZAP6_9BILA|nr:Metalloendopeptidase [Meloidogyne graminicola]